MVARPEFNRARDEAQRLPTTIYVLGVKFQQVAEVPPEPAMPKQPEPDNDLDPGIELGIDVAAAKVVVAVSWLALSLLGLAAAAGLALRVFRIAAGI
jgi:hypothetical protein